MIRTLFLLFFLTSGLIAQAQGLKVLITEKKSGKRVVLMAQNRTADTLNVFLMVNAEGYRRSASKPVIKNIPPNSSVPMITLIELKAEPRHYTYDLIVNSLEDAKDLVFERQENDIERIVSGKLVIFTAEACEACETLIDRLTENRITHRAFDIHEEEVIYRQFLSYIERQLTEETKIRLPVIWNKDEVIFGYDNLESIVTILSD
ncbi:hypothetical protein [Altibacter sp.]|uniref:hypothetical protein n=1 Tax=Altibacter sp. TaxID=2024823 RepID=UPI0025900292|nr:hypothetical protein [Altibacter sp.]MCW9037672.1 hypothetical protein [Altibacter sp.]